MARKSPFVFDYDHTKIGQSVAIHADCREWMSRVEPNSIHAIVTDPPFGFKEFEADQLKKLESGKGGIWRLPPSFDGHTRSPLPRFTALDATERKQMREFFLSWSVLAVKALRPGGHVFIATNAFIAALLYEALIEGGLEFRGQIIRTVRTLRGGDRPKNAEEEFPDVSTLPKGCYEPWGLFRKPIGNITVGECLRTWQTGGLRRISPTRPFEDIIESERTPKRERVINGHPNIKPQSYMRRIVHAALPLGVGVIVDPFMGSGSTLAACEAMGLAGIGLERYRDYYDEACKSIPKLKDLSVQIPQTTSDLLF